MSFAVFRLQTKQQYTIALCYVTVAALRHAVLHHAALRCNLHSVTLHYVALHGSGVCEINTHPTCGQCRTPPIPPNVYNIYIYIYV